MLSPTLLYLTGDAPTARSLRARFLLAASVYADSHLGGAMRRLCASQVAQLLHESSILAASVASECAGTGDSSAA